MPSDERDRQLERALARHMSAAPDDAACPDAEVLAAYHERTLSLHEMARCKEHFLKCESCQEALSMMEATDSILNPELSAQEVAPVQMQIENSIAETVVEERPVPVSLPVVGSAYAGKSADSVEKKRRGVLPWLVPVGALAAAALIWAFVQQRQTELNSSSAEVAENRELQQPNASPPAAPPIAGADTQPPASPKTEPSVPGNPTSSPLQNRPSANEAAELPKDTERDAYNSKSEVVIPQSDRRNRQAADNLTQPEVSAGAAAKAAPSPAPPTESSGALAPNSRASSMGQMSVPAQNYQNAMKEKKTMDAQAEIASRLDTLSAATVRKIASTDRSVIVAPGDRQVWVAKSAGAVVHSSDAGRTWSPQNTGVSADLLTGSAPSASVVWVVGKSGTILLTTDGGAHWKRIPSPIFDDIGGIHASDALHATVWDAANRRSFQTIDGGLRWTTAANE
jgi:hypothetical protein